MFKKWTAALTAAVYLFTFLPVSPLAAEPSLPKPSVFETGVPEALGRVDAAERGVRSGTLVILQDAHSIPEAQRSLWKLIEHFQERAEVRAVYLEGASGRLDPALLQTFPDQTKLAEVLNEYLGRGEMPGGSMAAVLSPYDSVYEGSEDWALYEEGIRLYVAASRLSAGVIEHLAGLQTALEEEKNLHYPPVLREADRRIEALYRDPSQLSESLRALASILPPEEEALKTLLRLGDSGSGSAGKAPETEIRVWAEQIRSTLESRPHRDSNKEQIRRFSSLFQLYQTSALSAPAFVRALEKISSEAGLGLSAPKAVLETAEEGRMIEHLEDSPVYPLFEAYAARVKEHLISDERARELDRRTESLRKLGRLARLEIAFTDWEKLRAGSLRGAGLAEVWDALEPARLFYENAGRRDEAFLERMRPRLAAGEAVIFITGGFHGEEIRRRVQGEGFSVLKVTPSFSSLPAEDLYARQMRGEVSWKSRMEPSNGRVPLFESFHRGVRESLLADAASSEDRVRVLRLWRDRLLARLFAEGRPGDAAFFLEFFDEGDGAAAPADPFWLQWQANIRSFVSRLEALRAQGELEPEQILSLAELAAIPAYAAAGANLVPGSSIGEAAVFLEAGAPLIPGAPRSELRTAADTGPAPRIPAVTDEARGRQWDLVEDEQGFLGEGERARFILGTFEGKYIAWGQSKTRSASFMAQEAIYEKLDGGRRDFAPLRVIHRERQMLGFEILPEGGELLSRARENFRARGLDERLELLSVLARSLAYLNSLGILHRDLKPSNIYLPQTLLMSDSWTRAELQEFPPVLFDFENAVMFEPGTFEGAGPYRAIVEAEKGSAMPAISRFYAPFSDEVLTGPDAEAGLSKDVLRFQHRFEFDLFSFGVTAAWVLGLDVRGTNTQARNEEIIRTSGLPAEVKDLLLELTDKERAISDISAAWEKVISMVESLADQRRQEPGAFEANIPGFALDEEAPEVEAREEELEALAAEGTRTMELPPLTADEKADKTLPLTGLGTGTESFSVSSTTALSLEEAVKRVEAAQREMVLRGPDSFKEVHSRLFNELGEIFSDGFSPEEMMRVFAWFENRYRYSTVSYGVHATRYHGARSSAAELTARGVLLRGLTPRPEGTLRIYLGGDGFNQLSIDPGRSGADLFFINRFMLLTQEELDFTKRLAPKTDLPFEQKAGSFVKRPENVKRPSSIRNEIMNQGLVYTIMKKMIMKAVEADPTPRVLMESRGSALFFRELERLFELEIKEGPIRAALLDSIRMRREGLQASGEAAKEDLQEFFDTQIRLLENGRFFEEKARGLYEKFRARYPGQGPFEIVDIGVQGGQQMLLEQSVRYFEKENAPRFLHRLGSAPGSVLDHYDFNDNSDTEDLGALEYFRFVDFSLEKTTDPMQPVFEASAPAITAAALIFTAEAFHRSAERESLLAAIQPLADLPETGFVMLDMDGTLTMHPLTLESMPRTTEQIVRLLQRGVPVVINTLNSTAEMRRRIFEPVRYLLSVQRETHLLKGLSGYARKDGESFDRQTGTMPMVYTTIDGDENYTYVEMPGPSAKEHAVLDFQRRSGRTKFIFFDDQFGPRGWAKSALGIPGGVYVNVDDEVEGAVEGTVTDPGAVGVKGTGRWLRLLNAVIDARSELRSENAQGLDGKLPPEILTLTDEGQGVQWSYDASQVLGEGERTVYYRGLLNGQPAAFGFPKTAPDAYMAQAELHAELAGRADTVRLRAFHPGRKFLVFDILPEGGKTLMQAVETLNTWKLDRRVRLLSRVAETMRDFSVLGILHRDLKPDNIFLPPELLNNPEWTEADLRTHPPILFDFDLAMLLTPGTRDPRSGAYTAVYKDELLRGMEAVTMDYAPFPDEMLRKPGRLSAARFREATKSFQHDPAFDAFSFGVMAAWLFGRTVAGFQYQEAIDREIQNSPLPLSFKRFLGELLDKGARVQDAERVWNWALARLEVLGPEAAAMQQESAKFQEAGTALAGDPDLNRRDRPTRNDPDALPPPVNRSELRVEPRAERFLGDPAAEGTWTRLAALLKPASASATQTEDASLTVDEARAVLLETGSEPEILQGRLLDFAVRLNREREVRDYANVLANVRDLQSLLEKASERLLAKAGNRRVYLALDLPEAEAAALGGVIAGILGEVRGQVENVVLSSSAEGRPLRLSGSFIRGLEASGYPSVVQDPSLTRSESLIDLTGQSRLGLASFGLPAKLPPAVRRVVEIGHEGDFSSLSFEEKAVLVRLKVFLALAVALEEELTEASLIRQYGLESLLGEEGRTFVFSGSRIEIVLESFHALMKAERAFAASA